MCSSDLITMYERSSNQEAYIKVFEVLRVAQRSSTEGADMNVPHIYINGNLVVVYNGNNETLGRLLNQMFTEFIY